MHKAVIFDRDGTLVEHVPYMHKLDDVRFVSGIQTGLQLLTSLHYEMFIVTNQSGVGRGYFKLEDALAINNYIKQHLFTFGVNIRDIKMCPHSPKDRCKCRKPKTRMIDELVEQYDIDRDLSYFIGDSNVDVHTAINAGIQPILITKNTEKIVELAYKPKHVAFDFKEAIYHIVIDYAKRCAGNENRKQN